MPVSTDRWITILSFFFFFTLGEGQSDESVLPYISFLQIGNPIWHTEIKIIDRERQSYGKTTHTVTVYDTFELR